MEKELIKFKQFEAKMPFIEVIHNNIKINLLIDSGSEYSQIDSNILDLLLYEETNECIVGMVSATDDNDIKFPIIKLPIKIGDVEYKAEFSAMNMYHIYQHCKEKYGIPVRGFLGSDFLYNNSLILDFNKQLIKYTDGIQTSIDFEASECPEATEQT